MTLDKIMIHQVITINKEDTVKDALNIMNEHKINGAPVVDKDNNLVGMLVKADIYRFLMEDGHYEDYPVEVVMTKDVIVGNKEENIYEVAKRLRSNNIIAMPILDSEDKVAGLVTLEKVVDYFLEE